MAKVDLTSESYFASLLDVEEVIHIKPHSCVSWDLSNVKLVLTRVIPDRNVLIVSLACVATVVSSLFL